MQGYNKGTLEPILLVYSNRYIEASTEGYDKWRLGPFILVYYNG
jgi:hypothetical protein